MFKELSPLLSTRSLILTVGSIKDEKIRVTVTPRPTSKEEAREISQPFVVEGTAEELDTELPKAIATYTGEILTLEQSIARLKASTAEALAAIKAENDKKVAEAKKKPGSTTTTPAAKAEPSKPPAPPSLFDTPGDEQKPSATAAASPAIAAAQPSMFDEEEEILKEAFDGTEDKLIAA